MMRNWFNKFKNIIGHNWIIIVEIFLLVMMGVLHALEAGHVADFYPINGDFQNYNPVRRLLNGQVVYKDFQDYLGIGHLYIGSFLTFLFGGTFVASLSAFCLASFMSTALIFFVISKAVLSDSKSALAVTDLLMVILLLQPTFLQAISADEKIYNALNSSIISGNSARMLRGMILPICCSICIFVGWYIKRKISIQKLKSKETWLAIMVGIAAGFCFPFSNDYGVSCWVCALFMISFIVLARKRKLGVTVQCLLIGIISSIFSLFVTVEITTLGHFSEWMSATFGTAGYQSWYYNSSEKSFYIFDLDCSYYIFIQALLCIFYLGKLWQKKASRDSLYRYGILAYLNMVAFCATEEYKLLSGGRSENVALVVLFGTVVVEAIHFLIGKSANGYVNIMIKVAVIVCGACVVSAMVDEIRFCFLTERDENEMYVEKVGWLTKLGEDIVSTTDFLKNKTFFATYATAQQLIAGDFQPSGTDYIIHVLGDEQRERYSQAFEEGEFDYATTINEDYTGWECWLQRANWFFYKGLFENWHPVYANSYEVYWERNTDDLKNMIYEDMDISVTIQQIDDNTQKIVIRTDPDISGMANVLVEYGLKKNKKIGSYFQFNSMVQVVNTGNKLFGEDFESYNIRPDGKEYIPVSVINGYGEMTLIGMPESTVVLKIFSADCTSIYQVQYQYVYVDQIIEYDACYALHIANNNRMKNVLDSKTKIFINGQECTIGAYEGEYIVLNKEEVTGLNNKMLNDGNVFRVQ